MKKKASLWISGITTVAMLTVAVGSFAAWDTLSAKSTVDALKVTVNDPVVLEATTTETAAADLGTLAKTSSDDLAVTGRSDSVEVGTIKAKLTNAAKVTDTIKTTYVADISGDDLKGSYEAVLVDSGSEKATTDDLALDKTSGDEKTFAVKVKPAASTTEAQMLQDKNKEIKVNITLTTSKTTAP